MMSDPSITPELVAAYWLCQRKAFLLLRGDAGEPPHGYVKLIDAHASKSLSNFLDGLRTAGFKVQQSEGQVRIGHADVITRATLKTDGLEAKIDALVRMRHESSGTREHYEPHLVVGTHTISQECKIRLAFIGHVLAEAGHSHAEAGTIVNVAGDASRIPLMKLIPKLGPIIDTLKAWRVTLPAQPPPVILNDHCPICPFRKACLDQAEKEDNLSLLDRMTPKVMRKYHKKGIFTVNQLSYLFKPRRQRKGSSGTRMGKLRA